MVRAADAAALPTALVPLKLNCKNRLGDQTYAARLQDDNPHSVNVVHLDPPASRRVSDSRRDRGQARVHSREEILPLRSGALGPGNPRLVRAGRLQLSHVLRPVEAAARRRDLVERSTRERVDVARRDVESRRGRIDVGAVERHGTPGRSLGALRVVNRCRDHSRCLVLAVAVARRAREEGDDDLRPEPARDPQGITQRLANKLLLTFLTGFHDRRGGG